MEEQLLFGKYQIIRQIGRGGTSTVLLAEHRKMNSLRVIKRINKTQTIHHIETNQEISILKNLKHSNIPIIYDIEEDEAYIYIIEEYLTGDTLTVFRLSQKNLKEDLLIRFSIQICELIEYLHCRDIPILYLDLKPDNLIISDGKIKIIDFGTAIYKNMANQRKASLGTVYFASPEQMEQKSVDERSDIYGIGMILYFLVTGHEFVKRRENGTHIEEVARCSKALNRIINRCLSQNPFCRYRTVKQLLTALSAIGEERKQSDSSIKSLTIAIAGAQSRMGTTHIALLLTSYFNQIGHSCLCQEKNDHNIVRAIIARYREVPCNNGIYKLFSCYLKPQYNESIQFNEQFFSIHISDMGRLENHRLEEFLKYDIKLLVLGGKEWELNSAEKAVDILCETEEVQYLFNFMEGMEYLKIMNNMKEKRCCRVPFIPDPFLRHKDARIANFAEQILGENKETRICGSAKKRKTRRRYQ